jgi:A/G-specific adenine glycosylase
MQAAEQSLLLAWAASSGRSFPWRGEVSPYAAVMAELMLIRTRAPQALEVWTTFLGKYPTLHDASRAGRHELEQSLAQLGLRWRIRLVVDFIQEASSDPSWFEHLEQLPGCGSYVTRATRLGVFGAGRLPIDVTIARVLARYWGIAHNDPRRSPVLQRRVDDLGDQDRSTFFALLDLAAIICTPSNPACARCPIRASCVTGSASTSQNRITS